MSRVPDAVSTPGELGTGPLCALGATVVEVEPGDLIALVVGTTELGTVVPADGPELAGRVECDRSVAVSEPVPEGVAAVPTTEVVEVPGTDAEVPDGAVAGVDSCCCDPVAQVPAT